MSESRLTFIEDLGGRKALYQCSCGVRKAMYKYNVDSGNSLSCGCINREITSARRTSHGATRKGKKNYPKSYRTWMHMRHRCLSESDPRYEDYGGRGISICERWSDYANFLADMGEAPSEKHSLDRIDTTTITPGSTGLLVATDTDWQANGVFDASSNLTQDSAHYAGQISVCSGYRTCTSSVGVSGNFNAAGGGIPGHKWVQIIVRESAAQFFVSVPNYGVPFAGGSWRQPPNGRR